MPCRFLHIGGKRNRAAFLEGGAADVEVVLRQVRSDRGEDDGAGRRGLGSRLRRWRDVNGDDDSQCDRGDE
jgi:hypothetical protein